MDSRLYRNDEAQQAAPHYLVIPAFELESIHRTSKAKLQGLSISGVDASLRWHDE
jgi:hypothetical protein